MKAALIITALLLILLFETGCTYDKEELLAPGNTCDTLTVTYNGTVKPILTANCTGCHSGPNAAAGIQLDEYSLVKGHAVSGRLLGVLTHSSGFSPMPKNAPKLSDCNIAKIRVWAATGAPDN